MKSTHNVLRHYKFIKKEVESKQFLKKFLVSFLVVALLTSQNLVYASEVFPHQYKSGDYTFEKISHPDKATKTADGIVDYVGNGKVSTNDQNQGDRGQSYSWASVAYGDYVYVGTCYAAMGQTLTLMDSVLGDSFDKDVMEATLKALFNGTFFYGQEDGVDSKGILVKVNVHTGKVTLLMSESTTNEAPLFRNAVCFKDKLYFCGSVSVNGFGLPSIYEVDPSNDAIQCIYTGMTTQEYAQAYKQGICTGIRGMAVHGDRLVVSCVGLEGPYLLISSHPSDGKSAFKKIATQEDLFNYPAYHYHDSIYGGSIWEVASYNDCLYVALCTGTPDNKPDDHTMQSFAVVKGKENKDGTWKWTSVIGDQKKDHARYTFGIDPARTRSGACHLAVYNGYLYIGEYEDIEIALEDLLFNKNVQFLAKNLEQSVNVYRMDKDENIELVVGDATQMFPQGSLSKLGSGFNRHENQYVWQSEVYDGKLFLSTFDSSSLLEPIGQFTNGDLVHQTPEQWKTQLNYLKVLIELLVHKDNSDSQVVQYSNDMNDRTASLLVEQAIHDANTRKSSQGSQLYSRKNENITLTDEQTNQLVAGLVKGEIVPNTLEDDMSQSLLSLNGKLTTWLNALDEVSSEKFAEFYEEMYQSFAEQSQKLPDSLKDIYNTLLTAFAKDNLKAFVKILKYLSQATRGFDLYVSEDGTHFQTITKDGFNDPYNHGLRTFASNDNWMVVGTANPFNGTQLWKLTSDKIPQVKQYTLTFDSLGGSPIESMKADEKTVIDLTQYVPQKEGYTFAGWCCDTSLSDRVSQVTLNQDMTVYAKWTQTNQEEKPITPTDTKPPKDDTPIKDNSHQSQTIVTTSDENQLIGWLCIFIISAGIIYSFVKRKKLYKK